MQVDVDPHIQVVLEDIAAALGTSADALAGRILRSALAPFAAAASSLPALHSSAPGDGAQPQRAAGEGRLDPGTAGDTDEDIPADLIEFLRRGW